MFTWAVRDFTVKADMRQYFGVSAPSVHQMVLMLEGAGFIA
jgi:hypothetical protein